jgi:hypothetical protein
MRGNDPWWVWLLAVASIVPWIAAAIWIHLRRRDGEDVVPSAGERARRRLRVP